MLPHQPLQLYRQPGISIRHHILHLQLPRSRLETHLRQDAAELARGEPRVVQGLVAEELHFAAVEDERRGVEGLVEAETGGGEAGAGAAFGEAHVFELRARVGDVFVVELAVDVLAADDVLEPWATGREQGGGDGAGDGKFLLGLLFGHD